ncbi:MFS transporter [Thermoactinospora rubra]|uniref:MFS transporter n=1 Tax=Thermoactinospora rubra TaxID=1088767 RepID=UPI001301A0E9|nr:MFS transporter [Thermoactinospora rubra]
MTTGVLRNPDFRLFLTSHILNETGANVARVALPLVAVLSLHASPFEVGLLAALQNAANLLIGLPAGVWVDRLRRRRVMIVTDTIRFFLLAAIPVLALQQLLTMPILYGIALLAGCAQVFNDVADQTYLPGLVSREQLPDGNAKLQIVRSAGFGGGPSVGGAIVQLIGAPLTMLVTALSALGSAVALSRIKAPDPRSERVSRGLVHDVVEGVTFVSRDRIMRINLVVNASTTLFVSGVLALGVLFLAEDVGLEPAVIGLVLVGGGIGGVSSGMLARRLIDRYGVARVSWVPLLVTSPFALLLPMTQADWRVSFYVITSAVITFGMSLFGVGALSYRQSVTPSHLLGRVNAAHQFVTWGMVPLGGLLAGLLATHLTVRGALWVLMTGKVLSALPILKSPIVRMRDFELAQDRS